MQAGTHLGELQVDPVNQGARLEDVGYLEGLTSEGALIVGGVEWRLVHDWMKVKVVCCAEG